MIDEEVEQELFEAPIEITNWRTTPTIGKLVEALAAADLEFEDLKKDRDNPYFHSKYTDLASGITATKKALARHGVHIFQIPFAADGKAGAHTKIAHVSDEAIDCDLVFKTARDDPQGAASAITYARRYSREAMLDISGEMMDDDGSLASGKNRDVGPKPPKAEAKPEPKAEAKAKPKERTWAQQFWATAEANKKTREQVREYLKTFNVEHTKDVPVDKQKQALAWAETNDIPFPSDPV